ncbi:hypothetical protein MUA02_19960 [Enterobacteriaceae bacterium H20N1]|uniref:Uncharacterized protein n=1 Tax=Dryocola boscaweniae TaxID=2925397 RepID=A0A9X3AEF6_9ENTR|nr:hypothetical protein [Dryocola boscaweniae]MCT4704133.1 hypothetical protein [Dryocola boscaweniae]MCT4717316.1 hypothetical protein [Dryocola boscaweniae]MCT4721301.1 hypothetical protein [Dryocola boscaweniae]
MKISIWKVLAVLFGILAISSAVENIFVAYFYISENVPFKSDIAYVSGKITFSVVMFILAFFSFKQSKK